MFKLWPIGANSWIKDVDFQALTYDSFRHRGH